MNRIYRYVLVHDHGIAPCPADGLVTLGTCKPMIRRTAKVGDWVLGFRRGSLEHGMLLWGGRVKDIASHGEYERLYRGRPDALYREGPNGTFDRVDPEYHEAEYEMSTDLSGPVLIFDPELSVYLEGRPVPLPADLSHLAPVGRGHRVNGTQAGDTHALEAWIRSIKRPETVQDRELQKPRMRCC